MQFKVATQSRVDICAVNVASMRRQTLDSITKSNAILRSTEVGLYIARGIQIAGGGVGKLLGTLGEAGLLRLNQTTALYQKTVLLKNKALELRSISCSPTPFSRAPSFCRFKPLAQQLAREKTKFADIQGALVYRQKEKTLLLVDCAQGSTASTKIRLTGDPFLKNKGFYETYEK